MPRHLRDGAGNHSNCKIRRLQHFASLGKKKLLMAGYSNKLCFILILLIHLVTSDQSLASTESQENVTTKDHKDGDPSSALCK